MKQLRKIISHFGWRNDMEYIPDNWVVLKMIHESKTYYKVLGGWSGGYLDGDYWRLNSGVVKVEEEPNHWLFYGYSGSVYRCHKTSYELRHNNASAYNQLKQKYGDAVTMMNEETKWDELTYES